VAEWDSGTPPTPTDSRGMDSEAVLKTGGQETAISVFREILICSVEFNARTHEAVVGSITGSICDEVPGLRSRLRGRECSSKGSGTKIGGSTAGVVDGAMVRRAGRHSTVGPNTLLNGSGIKSCESA
jgi:hypothetical protein